jgi:hypothetical protein
MSVLTDEHVPRVFITTLLSNGYEVVKAKDVFGEATDDERLLQYCGEEGHLLVTNYLRDEPEDAVRTLERVFVQYPPDELQNELVWLDQWRQ